MNRATRPPINTITEQAPPHIRWLIRRDTREVVNIDEQSHELGWQEEDFVRLLRERNIIGMVAERNENIVGFMLYALHPNRLEVLRFAVHPDLRFQGIGKQMVRKLVGKLAPQRRNKILVDVDERCLGEQLFLKRCGFRATDVVSIGEYDTYRFRYDFRQLAEVG